jgi:hypothetical protein
LLTTMDEGTTGLDGQKREMLLGSGVVWFDALESASGASAGPMSHAKASRTEMWYAAVGRRTLVAEPGSARRVT